MNRSNGGGLESRLRQEMAGDVLFDRFSRGRYSTDASIYQIEPVGVVVPRSTQDLATALSLAAEHGVPIVPRGGGTSQGGQAIGPGLVIDTSKYLTGITAFDGQAGTARVEPGVVLDRLNAYLKPHGLVFPVDPATAAQATIGGMAGNNSAGARSIRYGLMVDNVRSVDAALADGRRFTFASLPADLGAAARNGLDPEYVALARAIRAIFVREADELERRLPRVLRNVAGYNLQRVGPPQYNLAHLLVGSEGTLAFFTSIELQLKPLPAATTVGVCHFPTLRAALDATQHVVTLEPSAVELVDATLLALAREQPVFRGAVSRFVRGHPQALLLVEFAGADAAGVKRDLVRLEDLMGGLGFPGAVVRAEDPAFQREIWAVRRQCLNLVMSMKGDVKPVSFIEDCAVPLQHLAEYSDRLTEVFRRHGTTGTWYAHASVGCLHVRPALNLKNATDVKRMRAIAEEAHAIVRDLEGSHSGEHGDGIVRSEFLEGMLGRRIARAFVEIKQCFDPNGLMNPGKIVNPPRMDDRTLFRYGPAYGATAARVTEASPSPHPFSAALDWSDWHGLLGAVEMCNNNGACRKMSPGVMCPSYRVTKDERDTTRGRANTLRLALTGQLGADAMASEEMYQTLDLCVGCKGCRRECPTGVDMARMKLEVLHRRRQRHGVPIGRRLVASLPRYAPIAARLPWLFNARNRSALLARLGERWLGISRRRRLPEWRRDAYRANSGGGPAGEDSRQSPAHVRPQVLLWVDTFNTYFEPENAHAAEAVLVAAGYDVMSPRTGGRPACCGRTFLSAGMVPEARAEMQRTLRVLARSAAQDVPIIGLEPSCLLTMRDEAMALLPSDETRQVAARAALLEEFLASEADRGSFTSPFRPRPGQMALVHGHCHQKALGVMAAVERALRLIPALDVQMIESGCCGMAGAFGYEAAHYDVSLRMGELELFPAVRRAEETVMVVADGTSCRHQIRDGTGRVAVHVARVLEEALR